MKFIAGSRGQQGTIKHEVNAVKLSPFGYVVLTVRSRWFVLWKVGEQQNYSVRLVQQQSRGCKSTSHAASQPPLIPEIIGTAARGRCLTVYVNIRKWLEACALKFWVPFLGEESKIIDDVSECQVPLKSVAQWWSCQINQSPATRRVRHERLPLRNQDVIALVWKEFGQF